MKQYISTQRNVSHVKKWSWRNNTKRTEESTFIAHWTQPKWSQDNRYGIRSLKQSRQTGHTDFHYEAHHAFIFQAVLFEEFPVAFRGIPLWIEDFSVSGKYNIKVLAQVNAKYMLSQHLNSAVRSTGSKCLNQDLELTARTDYSAVFIPTYALAALFSCYRRSLEAWKLSRLVNCMMVETSYH